MKKVIFALLIGISCVYPTLVQAQATRKIQGMVSLSDDAIVESAMGGSFRCYVYSFYNKEDADKNLKDFRENRIKAGGVPAQYYQDAKSVQLADINPEVGFTIEAVNDGYIMVLVGKDGYEMKPEMRKVTKNMTSPTFNVVKKKVKAQTGDMTKDTKELQEVLVEGKVLIGTSVSSRSVEEDGMLFLRINDLPFACRTRTNSRIIVQPYWLDGPDMGEHKVFAWAAPAIYDYAEFDCTQTRRMDFDKDANDLLGKFILDESTATRIEVKNDTVHLKHYIDTLSGHNPDESYPYPARAIIAVEDYNERYYLDTIHIDEGERTNYIKFLDFTYEKNLDVNLEDFEERLEIRPMDSNGEVKLGFAVGKATLDPKDTTNTRILAGARKELSDAFSQKSSKLKFMQVFGYSSPEGNEQSNLDLARRRADFALNEIKSAIPYNMHKAIRPSESMILGWDVVADSLERDGLTAEAQQVREIVAKYPNSLSNQGHAVQRLPYYATVIKPIYLPKLRTVRYTYTKVEDRTLSPEELVQMFDQGRDNEFNRAHYYHLIQHYWDDRKKPETRKRLEQIAKRALVNTRLTKDDLEEDDSLYNEGYWALAANILATSYIERDTFDLDLLRPFINRTMVTDSVTGAKYYAERLEQHRYKYDFKGEPIGIVKYTNYPEFIAEQMIMLLMQPGRKNMEELGHLTDMIENDPKCMSNPTYSKMLALANCKRGYYRAGANCTPERARRVRAEVSDISLSNSVIMNIAMADAEGDEAARSALMEQIYELPENSIAYYLRAIIELLRTTPNLDQAAEYLAESFKMDIRKMPIANNDQQLIYDRKKIIIPAFTKWEEMMKKEVYKRTFNKAAYEAMGLDSAYVEALKQQGTFEEMIAGCWTETTNESHPYYWYEQAIKARTSENENDVIQNLEKCIACNPEYLSVINIARYADEEVKASKRVVKLFEKFYLNEMRKKENDK